MIVYENGPGLRHYANLTPWKPEKIDENMGNHRQMIGLDASASRFQSVGDATSRRNLGLLIQLRWIAVIGQILTIAFVHNWLMIALPLDRMAIIIVLLVALNILSLLRLRRRDAITNTEMLVELLLDVTALTVQLYLSGGASNPFISLYLLQVILGAILIEAWSTWLVVAITAACFILLSFFNQPIDLPHQHGSEIFSLHIEGMFICFVLAACLLVLFITRINANLSARDIHLAEMRQQSAEEDHIVRMGLLASGAAHELSTPLSTLSVILNDWQRMPKLNNDPETSQEIVEMISQLDRCKAIVSGILLSSGEARAEGTVHTTLSHFLSVIIEEWRGLKQPASFEYVNLITSDKKIVSDLALRQVIFNVLDNAFEASQSWIGVSVGIQADLLVLSVRDAGPGFPQNLLDEFGKPYRTTKTRPGAGLGLFLVVSVIRKLGGSVFARNGDNGGACVTISLPVAALGSLG